MNSTPHPKPLQKPRRPRRLFPRPLHEVVTQATQPMMDKQGKLYSALLRDWATIVGKDRARFTHPKRLQFPAQEAIGATLHLEVHPAKAPEFTYMQEQILESCARYFGYRVIGRILLHPAHRLMRSAPPKGEAHPQPARLTPEEQSRIARLKALRETLRKE